MDLLSPTHYNSTLKREPTQEASASKNPVSDQKSSTSKAVYLELERLRQQLANYNEEEQLLIQELEDTKTQKKEGTSQQPVEQSPCESSF